MAARPNNRIGTADAGFPEITSVRATPYTIPTDAPESDGTFAWDSTTIIVVHIRAGNATGVGYTYADASAATFVDSVLETTVIGHNLMIVAAIWVDMAGAVRNQGRPGIASMAISAVDCALWDLKARLLDLPLVALLGHVHERAPVYGSGGFTSYDDRQLADQLSGWIAQGIPRVKMKVGRKPHDDMRRIVVARDAIGDDAELFVDANGGYSRKEALDVAYRFAEEADVRWFEEPRPSEDLKGLRLLRDHGPPGMDIAAGEYGYDVHYFKHMAQAQAMDCMQLDVTRCGGITGFLKAAAVCEAFSLPISAHCAPALSAHVCCAIGPLRHIEYFHDHVRIERMLFDGVPELVDGALEPDVSRAGLGLVFKEADAARIASSVT